MTNDLPEALFANPVWHALQTKHRHLGVFRGEACRYPSDIAPFAAVAAPSESALHSLHSLLATGEYVWIIGEDYPRVDGLIFESTLECLQLVLPEQVSPPAIGHEIVSLSCANASEMVALTDVAFPGFFRSRTCEMGSYYGVRSNGELVAMGGERLMLEGYPEISGICTHPEHRGKGLASSLIWHLALHHRRAGLVPWLHVASRNNNAIDLYLRMGFITIRKVQLHRVGRSEKES